MTANLKIFKASKRESTKRVAAQARVSYPLALALASEIGVEKIGNAYAWTLGDYVVLMKLLAAEAAAAAREIDEDDDEEE